MSSSVTSPNSGPPSQGVWSSVAPYVVPPVAASLAIVPVFRDMVAKSAQQKGEPVPSMTFKEGVKGGSKMAPTVGGIVGTQMAIQRVVEQAVKQDSQPGNVFSKLASSAVVGMTSAPVLAVFNGQTMGWTAREALKKFSLKQGGAIAAQETAFVGGLSVADNVAAVMKEALGDNKVVDYMAAFVSGVAGSVAGHPANTALTRWQSGMSVDKVRQLMWGVCRRARAIGGFSVGYKFCKEALGATTAPPKNGH